MELEERLQKQFDFLKEIDKSKEIFRQNYLTDGSRKENDAEHAFHLAIMVFILSEYSNEEIQILKTIKMVLIHDLIEIDAGDTYAYDVQGNKTKRERELKAAERIFNLLPKDQAKEIRELWDEFEAQETKEAKFANTLDKIQPTLLNHSSEGKSWREHEVHKSQILKRNEKTADGSQELWDYANNHFIQPNIGKAIKE